MLLLANFTRSRMQQKTYGSFSTTLYKSEKKVNLKISVLTEVKTGERMN